MPDTSDFVLPNGFTFFASTAGSPGTWALDKDPVSAARKAAERNGSYPHYVQVWYAPYETTAISEMGGLEWTPSTANTMVPIGFFKLTASTIKKSKNKRLTHEEFMDYWFDAFNESYKAWVK